MPEQRIEIHIDDVLSGDVQKNALELVAFLRENGTEFERGKGYWADKCYWMIKHKDEYICFILIGSEDDAASESWTVWSDDSASDCYAKAYLDERIKDIAWKHIDYCGKCGGCKNPGGSRKIIFRKEFSHVCITTFRFDNPDIKTVECIKKLVEFRKRHIDFSKTTACDEGCFGDKDIYGYSCIVAKKRMM